MGTMGRVENVLRTRRMEVGCVSLITLLRFLGGHYRIMLVFRTRYLNVIEAYRPYQQLDPRTLHSEILVADTSSPQ